MKIIVDAERCQGHTLCAMVFPEGLTPGEEDGHATVILDEVPAELVEKARRAVDGCPELALRLEG